MPEIVKAVFMNRFKHLIKSAVAIALTYVLCASALLQPMAVYAATLQAQQPAAEVADASGAQDSSAEDVSDDTANEASKDADSADAALDKAAPADAADEDAAANGEDAAAPESLDAGDEQTTDDTVIGDSEANSWRYQNGELRSDLQDDNATDLGIESRSMHEMPEGATLQGIDVSGHQKDIDWQKVKDAGIDFAILKIGNINAREPDGWYTDSRFQRNLSECERLGIPYGVYAYSYAKNADDAVKGANHIIALLEGHKPTLPVYLDLEDNSIKDTDHATIATAFCNTISAAGYTPGIYASASWFKNILTDPCFTNSGWNIWTAQYWYGQRYDASLGLGPEYPAKFDCWQYSSLSTVPGIDGNCDINYWYKDKFSLADGNPHITCRAHVARLGWQAAVSDGATAGTTGRSLALEALKVSLSSSDYDDGSAVEVDAHVSGTGWQGWDSPSPSEGGTTGQARAVEAVRLRLTGAIADDYDVWYRVHAAGIGWMGWAKDGEDAGTTGMSCPVEAVQAKLVRKGDAAPGSTQAASLTLPQISYASFSGSDWQNYVGQNIVSGTIGRSTPIHGLKALVESDISGSIEYRVHLSNIGWTDFVSDNALSGLENSTESIQAVQIRLTGDLAKYFDITYRVHADNIGWLGWTKNGMSAGTTSCSLNVQAIQIAIRRKGAATTGTAFYSRKADLPYVGFQNPSQYYQVSNRSVSIKNQGYGIFGYRTESRIPYNATRNDCINAMITRAYDYVGSTPYIWDYSCAPGVGVDCAGLVMQSLYATGMNLGRYNPWDHYYTPGHDHYANDMWSDPRFLHLAFSQRQRGDLICYSGHIAIYIGNDQIIEASSPKNGVRVHSVYVGYNIKGVLRPFV